MTKGSIAPIGWERSLIAAEKVKEMCLRTALTLDAAGIACAVIGGNAVADWISRVDEEAARNTRNVDILIERNDFSQVKTLLENSGFIQDQQWIETFRLASKASSKGGITLYYSGEKVRTTDAFPMPLVTQSERGCVYQVIQFDALVVMKLTAWRLIDRVHLRDMMNVGLIETIWLTKLPQLLSDRLCQLLNDPHG